MMQSYEGGANAYVIKPFGFPEFFDTVRQLGISWTVLNVSPGKPQN
jgi:DNA-binding response OmpR family regulator